MDLALFSSHPIGTEWGGVVGGIGEGKGGGKSNSLDWIDRAHSPKPIAISH